MCEIWALSLCVRIVIEVAPSTSSSTVQQAESTTSDQPAQGLVMASASVSQSAASHGTDARSGRITPQAPVLPLVSSAAATIVSGTDEPSSSAGNTFPVTAQRVPTASDEAVAASASSDIQPTPAITSAQQATITSAQQSIVTSSAFRGLRVGKRSHDPEEARLVEWFFLIAGDDFGTVETGFALLL